MIQRLRNIQEAVANSFRAQGSVFGHPFCLVTQYKGFCRNYLVGETPSGCWTTVGVLIEKGTKRASSIGRAIQYTNLGVWRKMSFLFSCLVMLMRGTAMSRLEWCLHCLIVAYARMLRVLVFL